ncbi:MAG: class I SAM-dependent methyltransferase [Pseudolabrys sp.]
MAYNPLRTFFESRIEGRGIWKWEHYFNIYHRHLQRFRGHDVHILEIGIYSGGSLDMWRDYFGPHCQIYGVDIEPVCREYEKDGIKVLIGDQGDPEFWQHFRQEVPILDVVIDDGGHLPEQQTISLVSLLPHLRPGGVYICEDVHGTGNAFTSHVHKLADDLNWFEDVQANPDDNARRIVCPPTPLQSSIASVNLYPFVVAIEKNQTAVTEFVAPKRGTHWQPFLK